MAAHLPVLLDLYPPDTVQGDLVAYDLLPDFRRHVRGVDEPLVATPLDGAVEIGARRLPIPVQILVDRTEAGILDGLVRVEVQPQVALLRGDLRREIRAAVLANQRGEAILAVTDL